VVCARPLVSVQARLLSCMENSEDFFYLPLGNPILSSA
jgi:hypothetical protein